MSGAADRLYVYAILGRQPLRLPPRGIGREPLHLVRKGRLAAVVGPLAEPPRPELRTLRAQEALVRRLFASSEALLPVRFGTLVTDERALADLLERRAAALAEALGAVRGCEQMTLRLLLRPGAPARPAGRAGPARAERPRGGAGTRYLERAAGAARVPELDPLRPLLSSWVRSERAQRHDTPPLLASIYHLIPRGRSRAYRAALRRGAGTLAVHVLASGPWPPYAFAEARLA